MWDDHRAIEHGRLIDSLGNLPALFTHDTMFNSFGEEFARTARIDTYRPLPMAMFFVEHALLGAHPAGHHAASVLLHAANVLLRTRGARRGRPHRR